METINFLSLDAIMQEERSKHSRRERQHACGPSIPRNYVKTQVQKKLFRLCAVIGIVFLAMSSFA